MFELLFKYPASIFHKGQFVFLTPWPVWVLAIAILLIGLERLLGIGIFNPATDKAQVLLIRDKIVELTVYSCYKPI